jgi:hypothetical protein
MKKMLRALGVLLLSAAVGIGAATPTFADDSNGPQERRDIREDAAKETKAPPIPIDVLLILLSMLR